MNQKDKLRRMCDMCYDFIDLRDTGKDYIDVDCEITKTYKDPKGFTPLECIEFSYGNYTVKIARNFEWVKFYVGAVLLLEGEDDARDYEDYASLIYSLILQAELAKAGIDVEMIGSIYDVIEILDATE